MLPDTTDSTKEFNLQYLAADIYLTVYNIDTTQQNSPTKYTISPNHPLATTVSMKIKLSSTLRQKRRINTTLQNYRQQTSTTSHTYATWRAYTHYSRTVRELSTCFFQSFPMSTPFPISPQCTQFLNGLARSSHNP